MKIKRRRKQKEAARIAAGVAWYRREQWPRLLEVAEDADELEDTYEEWLGIANERFDEFNVPGVLLKKVDVDIEELITWCGERGRPVDARARSEFVAEKVREMAEEGWY
jgi:hypothetical protein